MPGGYLYTYVTQNYGGSIKEGIPPLNDSKPAGSTFKCLYMGFKCDIILYYSMSRFTVFSNTHTAVLLQATRAPV